MTQLNKLPVLISQEQLLKMAGQDNFDKGLTLMRSASLSQLSIDQECVRAHIANFETQLNYHRLQLTASCTCPASDGFDFCEHCVYLCLHTNKQIQQIRSLAKGPDKSKILAYLLCLDKHDLARQCLTLIVDDANQYDRYLWKAILHQGEIDYSLLKAHITNLTRKPENLFSQRQVKAFFQKIERFLAELASDDAPEFDPEKMLRLLEYAFHRINLLLEQMDDSSGQHQQSIRYLRQLYSHCFVQNSCRDDTLAKRLFSFWITDRFDLLGDTLYPQLSHKTQRKFSAIVNAQWQTITPGGLTPSTQQAPAPEVPVATLKNWQQEKLARYLLAEAIQSDDPKLTQYYRKFFSKDAAHEQSSP